MDNIIFIGGIHGTGKSHMIGRVAKETPYIHLTASEIIRSRGGIDFSTDKRAQAVNPNQEVLIEGLMRTVTRDKKYILDGHFTLLDKEGEITCVPEHVFKRIAPKMLFIKLASPEVILKRLKARDNRMWDIETIERMQAAEIEYGTQIASRTGSRLTLLYDGQENIFKKLLAEAFYDRPKGRVGTEPSI